MRSLLTLILAGIAAAGFIPPQFVLDTNTVEGRDFPLFTLILSVDGMRHDYLAQIATDPQLQEKFPTLSSLIARGTFASKGAKSIFPSHTYPSHISIITGANPDTHGVIGNSKRGKGAPSFQYSRDVLVPSVFTAAQQSGNYITASVSWPVSAGGPFDFNVPDAFGTSEAEWVDLYQNYVKGPTSGVLPTLAQFKDMDDVKRTQLAIDFINGGANFLGIHLIELDHQEHLNGVFSKAAWDSLQVIDGQISQILNTVVAAGADFAANSYLFLVSDHGFRNYTTTCSPATQFGVGYKTIEVYGASGSFAFFPANATEQAEVDRVLAALPATCGVDKVFKGDDIRKTGGFLGSYAVLSAKDGYAFTASTTGNLIQNIKLSGAHGYDPEESDLLASFVALGPNVRRGARLTERVSLVDVGPTAAHVLGLQMPRFAGRVVEDIFE